MTAAPTYRRCQTCGGASMRDYEVLAPAGRVVLSLCVECRDAIAARRWELRAYPPRHPRAAAPWFDL